MYNNQASNVQGNIQNIAQVAASQKDFNAATCKINTCKGYFFADNAEANVQTYTPGQVVDMKIDISAPHTGVANVSIVSTKTNTMISPEIISFSDYASNAHTIPANNTAFSITMPSNLGSQCATAGDCVIQWFWDAPSVSQTYEACVDFTMGDSGASGSAPAITPSSSASAAVSSSPAAASSPPAATSLPDCGSPPPPTPPAASDCSGPPGM